MSPIKVCVFINHAVILINYRLNGVAWYLASVAKNVHGLEQLDNQHLQFAFR